MAEGGRVGALAWCGIIGPAVIVLAGLVAGAGRCRYPARRSALFLAAGLVALRRRVLPTWLGIVTLLIAAVLLVLPIGFVGVIFLMPVWTIIVAIVLAVRRSATATAPSS